MPRRYHRGMARQYPRGHDGTKPGEGADDTSVNHLTREAPDLAEEKAKQLEIKLEVAMAEVQSIGGKGDESAKGVIDKISQTGRRAIAGSIDCDPSQQRTPAELIGIEHSGGEATQSPGLGQERRKKQVRGFGRSV
jgi:hypothetical protein